MMELEVEARTGAPAGARSAERLTQRNGYRERAWETRAGRIELAIPKLRKGSYLPSFLEPRRTAEKALQAVIQAAYVHGLSTPADADVVRRWVTAACRRVRAAGSARRSTSGCTPSRTNECAWPSCGI